MTKHIAAVITLTPGGTTREPFGHNTMVRIKTMNKIRNKNRNKVRIHLNYFTTTIAVTTTTVATAVTTTL